MYLRTTLLEKGDLEKIAQKLGIRIEIINQRKGRAGDNVYRFRLFPQRDKYKRISPTTGRRVHAVCYHGHLDFFREIEKMDNQARIKSMLTGRRWVSLSQLMTEYLEDIYHTPMGYTWSPVPYGSACLCCRYVR